VNAEDIGISDSLWELIQKCWHSDKTRQPHIWEVMVGVGNAAGNWHTDMPLSGIKHREGSGEEDSDDLEYGKFWLFPVKPLFLRPSVQLYLETSPAM